LWTESGGPGDGAGVSSDTVQVSEG
jgi:hypothetical protein